MKPNSLALLLIAATTVISTGCAPVLVGTAATGALVAHDRRTTGTLIDDKSIIINLESTLFSDSQLESAHINVTSFNGQVLLTGEVPHEGMKTRAEEIAKADTRVRNVYNELAIAAPSALLARSNDVLISGKVKASLFQVDIDGFDPTRVKVTTERGIVYLMGIVTEAEAQAATDVVRRVGGVLKVVRLFEYQAVPTNSR
ncbi:MAG: BON domain-containing protein [Gammaproteobacteria bacterium]